MLYFFATPSTSPTLESAWSSAVALPESVRADTLMQRPEALALRAQVEQLSSQPLVAAPLVGTVLEQDLVYNVYQWPTEQSAAQLAVATSVL